MQIKKLVLILLTSTLFVGSIQTNVVAAPSEKEQKQEELRTLESKLEETVENINELETELITIAENIDKNIEKLKKAQEDYNNQYKDMKARIKYLYQNNTTSEQIEKIMKSKSFVELTNSVEYYNRIQEYDNEKLEKFKKTKKQISKLQTELQEERKTLEEKSKSYETEKEELENEIENKKIEISSIQDITARTYQVDTSRITAECNNETAQKIVDAAYSQLGTPYVWGGTSPNVGLDCSGLTQYCHRVAGLYISRTSGPQGTNGMVVSSPEPGDIVCYSGHVGIYIGDGYMIHAPQPGDVVRKQKVFGHPWYVRYW